MAELCAIIESRARAQGAALMGVVNTTPDSFFDGGRYAAPAEAVRRVDALLELGTALLDIGGESTRPGAKPVPALDQIERIGPALAHAVSRGALVSVDTTDPEVAAFALEKGARVVNDVSCLGNVDLARVAARHDAALIVTHSRGPMSKMAGFSQWPQDGYKDVVKEVRSEWEAARERACAVGVRRENVWFDPGFGFSKNASHSFELLRRLGELKASEALLVVGPGRKSFLAAADPAPADDRLGGTVAACVLAVQRGAHVLRVHDVKEVRQAMAVVRAATVSPEVVAPVEEPGGRHAR